MIIIIMINNINEVINDNVKILLMISNINE